MVGVVKGKTSSISLLRSAWGPTWYRPRENAKRLRATRTEKRADWQFLLEQSRKRDFDVLELGLLDEEEEADSTVDAVEAPPKRRGRKKGVPLDEANRLSIKAALKGKNKYKRTPLHRSRVGRSLKKIWKDRKAAGWTPKAKKCSVCGGRGHNKQTCPMAQDAEKTRHRKPRSFEHRWKIAAGIKKAYAAKKLISKESSLNGSGGSRGYQCSYCKKMGHNKRTCPQRRQESQTKEATSASLQSSQRASPEVQSSPKEERDGGTARPLKTSEVDDLQALYTVPVEVDAMWKLALECATRAYRSGVNRQRMDFTFPLLRDRVTVDPMLSPTGDVVRQFRVASLMVEAVLKGMKSQAGLEGRLDVGVLDEGEGTVYWEGKEISAMLFPQPQTLDVMISRVMMRRKRAPRLQLLVNPQWQPGQVVSDFGFGQLKTLRENFATSFEDVFFMKQISVFNDDVIVMRCYPSQWQVHLVEPSGQIVLVGTTREKPEFEKVLAMLQSSETALSALSWIDRFKTRYIERRKRLSPFPLSLSKAELENSFGNADLSIAERLKALNGSTKEGKLVTRLKDISLPSMDIITGEAVRDIKLDPVKQFASFLRVRE